MFDMAQADADGAIHAHLLLDTNWYCALRIAIHTAHQSG
jgi:hypothetical protein